MGPSQNEMSPESTKTRCAVSVCGSDPQSSSSGEREEDEEEEEDDDDEIGEDFLCLKCDRA